MSTPDVTKEAQQVTALLRHLSWAPISKVPGRYEVWGSGDKNGDEIIFPVNPENGDYKQLIERARRHLLRRYGAEAERIQDLLRVAVAANLNSTRWSKETNISAGLISWADGESVYEAARESLIAAARATKSKRAIHGKSSAFLAKRFMEQVFMGQTEVGSFVVTAHLPASSRFHINEKSEREARIDARRAETIPGEAVLNVFESSILAVRDTLTAYRKSPRIEMFEELVPEGVSLELVRSLATLSRNSDASVTIRRGEMSSYVREIPFESIDAPVLDRVAASFQKVPEPQYVRIIGEVSLLDNSTAVPVHIVRLDVNRGAPVKRVRVRLSPEQYDTAAAAHANKQWLRMSGSLEKDGRDWWLYNATDVNETPALNRPVGVQEQLFE